MANTFPEVETGSSATDSPSRWWTQPLSLFIRRNELTNEENSALSTPSVLGLVTTCAVFIIVLSYSDIISCHASFSVESVFESPSSTVWHIDLLVKNPSLTCPINYDSDDVYAKLASINAAVLKTSHTRSSRGYTSFSIDLATGNQSDVVAASPRVFDLDIKLSAKKMRFIFDYETGYLDVRCQNLMIGHEKIKCHSSFKKSKLCCYKNEV